MNDAEYKEWLSTTYTRFPPKLMMQTKLTSEIATAVCRNCRFYEPNGRRGGVCSQFQVPVSGSWFTCKLAMPAFVPDWHVLEDLPVQAAAPYHVTADTVAERVIPAKSLPQNR
jgi:hypothetical protein